MPIYEYVCPKCGLKFDLYRPFSKADEDAPCPKCKLPAKRAMSTFMAFDKYHNVIPGVGNVKSLYPETKPGTHKPGIWEPGTRKSRGPRKKSK